MFIDDKGICVPEGANSILLFEKFGNLWDYSEFDRVQLERIEFEASTPGEFLVLNPSFGTAVGLAMRERMEREKSKRETGVRLTMKSIELPDWFMSIPDEGDHKIAKRALSQFWNGDRHGYYHSIPDDTFEELKASIASPMPVSSQPDTGSTGFPWIAAISIIAMISVVLFVLVADWLGY